MEKAAAQSVEAYLARLPAPERAALEKLRATIRSAAPAAEEAISYQIPAFKLNGGLVAYAAFKKHCSFFPMSNNVTAALADEIAPWFTSKGTLQFTFDQPLPAALVRKIVKARIAENTQVKPKTRPRPKARAKAKA